MVSKQKQKIIKFPVCSLSSRATMSKRNKMGATYVVLNFQLPLLKKETREIHFNGVFYLTQYTLNTVSLGDTK